MGAQKFNCAHKFPQYAAPTFRLYEKFSNNIHVQKIILQYFAITNLQ